MVRMISISIPERIKVVIVAEVEDTEIDEALPSYEDVIREGPSAATAANLRYRTPSLRPDSSRPRQYSSSSASPQQYSSLLDPAPPPTTVLTPSLTTVTPPPSGPITRSPREPQAPRSSQPKYSSLPPAPGPGGPPPDYSITTSSLPEPPPSRKDRKREKSRIQRRVLGAGLAGASCRASQKEICPRKSEGVPLENVVDRFGNRERELKFEMAWGRGMSVAGFVTAGVKYR
ncbi:hypothetical protein C7212DRAFT_354961 [Tuber magnatum]|uniref:Uncharacterized protein n=1 Tax=Tuber magnatum TaxID=42249 RepID=A0A317SBV6_9PEZI|nr:hypothetical protein C7212DRAFT_354961 [Tuber magnatum]